MSELLYYPWYLDRWRKSRARIEMNAAARGLYRELLDYYYEFGSLPNEESALMNISGLRDSDFRKAWPNVAKWFRVSGDRLIQDQAEELRAQVIEHHKERQETGRQGAQKRWGNHSSANGSANGSGSSSATGSANSPGNANRKQKAESKKEPLVVPQNSLESVSVCVPQTAREARHTRTFDFETERAIAEAKRRAEVAADFAQTEANPWL